MNSSTIVQLGKSAILNWTFLSRGLWETSFYGQRPMTQMSYLATVVTILPRIVRSGFQLNIHSGGQWPH